VEVNQEVEGRGIGRVMIYLFWLMLIGLLTWFFNDFLENRANPNQSIQTSQFDSYVEVVLQRNFQGHYVVTGKINHTSVTMLVDTGATTVSISTELAAKLRLKRGREVVGYTANGKTRGYQTILDSVEVGRIEVKQVKAIILPRLGEEILLGMSFLRELEFSQQGRNLTLRQARLE
jgi:aspartyl protease family protein